MLPHVPTSSRSCCFELHNPPTPPPPASANQNMDSDSIGIWGMRYLGSMSLSLPVPHHHFPGPQGILQEARSPQTGLWAHWPWLKLSMPGHTQPTSSRISREPDTTTRWLIDASSQGLDSGKQDHLVGRAAEGLHEVTHVLS